MKFNTKTNKINYIITTGTAIALLGLGLLPMQASAQTHYPRPNEVNKRLENQHDRVQQGVKSGQLTHRQAKNIRLTDARVRYQMQRDRINHNGHLTSSEYKNLNHKLNKDSNRIYRDRHNG